MPLKDQDSIGIPYQGEGTGAGEGLSTALLSTLERDAAATKEIRSNKAKTSKVQASTVSQKISLKNRARYRVSVMNESSAALYLLFGDDETAVAPGGSGGAYYSVKLLAGGYWEDPVPGGYTGEIQGVWGAGVIAGDVAIVTEYL
jgi:hypothetical protein